MSPAEIFGAIVGMLSGLCLLMAYGAHDVGDQRRRLAYALLGLLILCMGLIASALS